MIVVPLITQQTKKILFNLEPSLLEYKSMMFYLQKSTYKYVYPIYITGAL